MAKISTILLISSLFIMIISLFLSAALFHSKTKVTNVRVYLQDTFNLSQPLAYGDVFAHQDPLTVGPDPNSASLGRIQSIVGFPALDASPDVHLSMDFIFTSGKYNGSTVITVGRNDVLQSVRQFAIVGGTGHFKLARGIVTSTTYSSDPPIYIYDLEIFQDHYGNLEIEIMKYVKTIF